MLTISAICTYGILLHGQQLMLEIQCGARCIYIYTCTCANVCLLQIPLYSDYPSMLYTGLQLAAVSNLPPVVLSKTKLIEELLESTAFVSLVFTLRSIYLYTYYMI